MKIMEMESVNHPKPTATRYAWEGASPLQVATSLRPRAYPCHGSAVLVHALTDQLPKTIYINVEQTPKPRRTAELTQAGIDRAFSAKQRESNFFYQFEDWPSSSSPANKLAGWRSEPYRSTPAGST